MHESTRNKVSRSHQAICGSFRGLEVGAENFRFLSFLYNCVHIYVMTHGTYLCTVGIKYIYFPTVHMISRAVSTQVEQVFLRFIESNIRRKSMNVRMFVLLLLYKLNVYLQVIIYII